MRRAAVIVLAALVALPATVSAGWLGDALNSAIESTTRRKIDEKVNEAADSAEQGIRNGGNNKEKGQEPSSEEKVKSGSSGGTSQASGQSGGSGTSGDGQEVKTAAKTGATGKAEAADMSVYRNYDFIPGGKVIFFDDFSDTDAGEFPPRWTFKGPYGGGGTLEVAEMGGKRFFFSRPPEAEHGQDDTVVYIRMKDMEDLPKKFTVEFDALFEEVNGYSTRYKLLVLTAEGQIHDESPGTLAVNSTHAVSKSNSSRYSKSDGQLHHISVMINDTFLKAYVDGDRVINDPDGVERPIKHIGMVLTPEGGVSQKKLMFTNFRLAEGGKDIPKALETDGRIIAHGIQFDTGSDKLKPQSYSTLKSIKDILQKDPGLKFRIEGHTDNQGNPGINQPLSERRAEAVKAWLAANGIVADRLTSQGFGDTKPLSNNDTPEGRANNRRVEFVKI